MQILRTVEQAHTGKQTNEPEIMIAVQMRNENVIYFTALYLVFGKLHLSSFAAINQKTLLHGL